MRNEVLLVAALDGPGSKDQDVHLFLLCYKRDNLKWEADAVRAALGRAFRAWEKTHDGHDYVKDNGSNWGDALSIPDEFLIKERIVFFCPLIQVKKDGTRCLEDARIDGQIVVDHNENLLTSGE
jgi:hypothetical protein